MILMQTLVMSVLLSMIAVMVMKWVLGRYMMAARNYRSTVTTARVAGYTQVILSSWNFGSSPSSIPALPDGKSIVYDPRGTGMVTIIMTSDEDQ